VSTQSWLGRRSIASCNHVDVAMMGSSIDACLLWLMDVFERYTESRAAELTATPSFDMVSPWFAPFAAVVG